MGQRIATGHGETAAHTRLKRLAALWAQAQGYSACAIEVSLPKCRYRVDVAACRVTRNEISATAVFECKQARPDLRRDNCCTVTTRERFATLEKRRQVIEKHLRIHYPQLRRGEWLFSEYDAYDFGAIKHQNHSRILRQLIALQHQLGHGTKFEKMAYYRSANLLFLVLPNNLFDPRDVPLGWGVLLESQGSLSLAQEPTWHEISTEDRIRFLHRIALAGTRRFNQQLEITFEEVLAEKRNLQLA